MAQSDIYVANDSFTTVLDGVPIVVHKGQTRVRAGHPLLKGKAALFDLLTVQYDVEQATKAPGEQRAAPASAPAKPADEPAKDDSKDAAKADAKDGK